MPPKSFSDLMASAGYSTERADTPNVLRESTVEWTPDGLGIGASSESPGSDRGRSARIYDDVNGKVVPGSMKRKPDDNIATDVKKEKAKNPYTGRNLNFPAEPVAPNIAPDPE